MAKWTRVQACHVVDAIKKFDLDCEKYPLPRNTFLIYNDKKYPAKHIRGIAYMIATGEEINYDEYTGGKETADFFKKLGFEVQYKPDKNQSKENKTNIETTYDWRSLEIEFQRIKLNYLKWFFYFTPHTEEIFSGSGKGSSYIVIDSHNGGSFSLFPTGNGYVYSGGQGMLKLPNTCFDANSELLSETRDIKNSLNYMVKQLRLSIEKYIDEQKYALVWEMLQNYFWIKVGLHEYTFDLEFEIDYPELRTDDIRDCILDSMYFGICLAEKIPTVFNDTDMKKFLSNKLRWDRFACCAFDCGPLAWGKGGYKPYSAIAKLKNEFVKSNFELLEIAVNKDELTDRCDNTRDFTIESLKDHYEFAALYYWKPLSEVRTYADFLKYKDEIKDLIINVQNRLNQLISKENLPLKQFSFTP